jgi:hypothetical protein
MPIDLAEIYADYADLVLLWGIVTLALVGIYLALHRIFIAMHRHRSRKVDAYLGEDTSDPEEDSWDWQTPVDPATQTAASSQAAMPSGMADLDVQPEDADHSQSTERIEYFDTISEASKTWAAAATDAAGSTPSIPQPGRLAPRIGKIAEHAYRRAAEFAALINPAMTGLSRVPAALAERAKRISGPAWTHLHRKAAFRSADPAHRDLAATAQTGGLSADAGPAIATAAPPRLRKSFGTVPRLSIITMCLAVALGYASNSRQPMEAGPALSDSQDKARRDVAASVDPLATASLRPNGFGWSVPSCSNALFCRAFLSGKPTSLRDQAPATYGPARGDERTRFESLSPDQLAAAAQVGAARAQAAAATALADQERQAAEGERARSAALQGSLLMLRKQIDAERTSMAAADKAREERLRDELAAARTVNVLRSIAGDARSLIGEAAGYVVTMIAERPAARLERQRSEGMVRDLSQARAQLEALEAEAAGGRNQATASLAQIGAARAQAGAATALAGQEHQAAEGERAKSAALQGSLLMLRKQIDAERTSMAAADKAREERLRDELATARTVDVLRSIAGDARSLIGEAAGYVVTMIAERPAARLERQRAEGMVRDLSQARAQLEALEAEAAGGRNQATASLAQIGAARAQAGAATALAGQEHQAAEGERAKSAALQGSLLMLRRQIDAEQTSMAAADKAQEERLRNELAAARTLDVLRRIAGNARSMLSEATGYVVTMVAERPAMNLERQRVEGLARDLSQARAQVEQLEAEAAGGRNQAKASLAAIGTARAQADAARKLADQERQTAESERARSAALQGALLDLHKQIDAERTSMAAADKAREERLRNELAAARTLDILQRIAGDAHALLGQATAYVVAMVAEIPAARLERQRTEEVARALSQARAQIEQFEATAADDRDRAEASLAQATGALDQERRKSEGLQGDLAAAKQSNGALVARADAAEQERASAVAARERAERAATETEQALTRERAAAASTRDELNKARQERDAAAAPSGPVASNLQGALDEQRETSIALARDLAAMRADSDRQRAETGSVQADPPPKPRPRPRATTATGQVKAVSQKASRSEVSNPSRVTRVRPLTLPYSLLPRRPRAIVLLNNEGP